MAKRRRSAPGVTDATSALGVLVGLVAWITGLLVALAVGFGMINGTLVIPVPGLSVVTEAAGYVVVVLALLGAILAVLDRRGR